MAYLFSQDVFHWFESLEPQKLRSRYLAPSLNTWRISTFFWNSGDAGTGARGEPAIQEQKQAGFQKKKTDGRWYSLSSSCFEPWQGADFCGVSWPSFLVSISQDLGTLVFWCLLLFFWDRWFSKVCSNVFIHFGRVNRFEHPHGLLI